MHSLQEEKSGLQPGGVWPKPDITADISNIPSLKIPAKYSKRPYEGNGSYPAMKTARVESDLNGGLSPGAFRNPRPSSAHEENDYREESREEDRDVLTHGRVSKDSFDSRSSVPLASDSWRTIAKPSHTEKRDAPTKEWKDDFARKPMPDRDRYESERLEWDRKRNELSARELAAHHARPGYIGPQLSRAAEDRFVQERIQSVRPIMESERVLKKGTYDTVMKVVMGSIGPKSRFGDEGGFDEATRESIRRSSASSALERSVYSKQSPASFGSSLPSFGGARLHDTGVALASSAVAPRSESWRNLSNEKSSAMSKPTWSSTAPRTESWRNSSASAGSESWRNLKKDVPQDSWVKSTNVIGSGHVAGGPNPISRTFDRFPTIGGRPPLGNEFSRDMRRF